jgi:hypothetical protein
VTKFINTRCSLEKKYFCNIQKVRHTSQKLGNVLFFCIKDLLDLDKLLTIDSRKCVILYFLGFKVTRGVDIQICGFEVTFLLQGISTLKTRGKLNFMHWRGQVGYKQSWLTTSS